MTKIINEKMSEDYDKIVTVFANTGQENDQTLEFVRRCDEEFGWGVIWVEAVIDPAMGQGTKHQTVSHNSADRSGFAFEEMIKKYGIPGPGFLHCTRELKERPIKDYARSIGWESGSYDLAIGIRRDEIDRVDPKYQEKRIVYPLAFRFPHSKPAVNAFWDSQSFRLNLKGYEGNCRWCWKKSLRKHLTIMSENPNVFDFPERMEKLYPKSGSNPNDQEKRFFRNRLTVNDIRVLSSKGNFEHAEDDSRVYQSDLFYGLELDVGGGCEESCEINFNEI